MKRLNNAKWTFSLSIAGLFSFMMGLCAEARSANAGNALFFVQAATDSSGDLPTVPTTEPAGAPDLVIRNVVNSPVSPRAGDTVVFTATVQNTGNAPSPDGTLLSVGFQNSSGIIAVSDWYVNSLQAGESVNLITNQNWTATAGSHSILATVDEGNRIAESNETNNGFVFALVVQEPLPQNRASSAYRFIDSLGVNTHFAFAWSTYHSRYPQVKDRLLELGVKHIRDGSGKAFLYKEGTASSAHFNDLAAWGVKLDLISNVSWTANDILDVVTANASAVEWIEGQNEADIFVSGDWVTADRTFQMLLWNTVQGSAFGELPVLDPSLSRSSRYATLGDLSAYGSFGNIHPYPGGQRPLSNLSTWISSVSNTSGALPIVATETGYHTALQTKSTHLPISERGEGKYIPRLVLDYFGKGIERTYIYQLYDHLAKSATNAEANFGLVRYDLSVRPAFTNLKNLIAILSDSATSMQPDSLSYSLSGSGLTKVRTALFQKTTGHYFLALWQDVSVWNTQTRKDIVNAPVQITATFGGAKRLWLYQPSAGQNPRATYTASTLNLSVPDEVIILEIEP